MSDTPSRYGMQAPGANGGGVSAPGYGRPLPAVDERLVAPEAHAQIVEGVVVRTMGANPPHALAHTEVGHVFRGCLAPGFLCAIDLLTRTSEDTDVAPDVSVYREGTDAATGGRFLEELAFEVHDTERMSHATKKAEALVKRGVRRLFCVRLDQKNVFEWSREADDWLVLEADTEITDACFSVPVPVRALLDRFVADDVVARALLAKNNRFIAKVLAERERQGETRGRAAGARSMLCTVLETRAPLSERQRAVLDACDDEERLQSWLRSALAGVSTERILGA